MGVMATEEEDDRWESFVDPKKSTGLGAQQKREPKPNLGDYITQVLMQKSPGSRHQRKFAVAVELVKLVTEAAYGLDHRWKNFIRLDKGKGVRIAPLRSLSEDQYECMVLLKRPFRMDAFRTVQRPADELPQHRCLVQVNPTLCKQEATLIHNEWEHYIDGNGYLRPMRILEWFNEGIEAACAVVLSENHNVDQLSVTTGDDGTMVMHVTMTKYENSVLEMNKFSVNIFPSIVLTSLPHTVKLHAPIPCFGPYIQGQKQFRQLVLEEVEEGKEVAFLDPKMEMGEGQVKGLCRDGRSWKLNISLTHFHVYQIIDRYSRGINFRHVLILMSILTSENQDTLKVLNNEMVVSTLFTVSSKKIHKLRNKGDWAMHLLQALCESLKFNFLPSFYLPRQNLLAVHRVSEEERQRAYHFLQELVTDIMEDPKSIFKYTNCRCRDDDDNDENEAPQPETEKVDPAQPTGNDDTLDVTLPSVTTDEKEADARSYSDKSSVKSGITSRRSTPQTMSRRESKQSVSRKSSLR